MAANFTKTFLILMAIASLAGAAAAQDSWDLYKPRTIRELKVISEAFLKDPDVVEMDAKKVPQFALSYNSYQSRVKVVYVGESRKISESRTALIKAWLRTLGKPKEILDMFESEYLLPRTRQNTGCRYRSRLRRIFRRN